MSACKGLKSTLLAVALSATVSAVSAFAQDTAQTQGQQSASAQTQQQPAPAASAQSFDQQPSKVDIFAGYSYANPKGSVIGIPIRPFDYGMAVHGTMWFNRYMGLGADFGYHLTNTQGFKYQTLMVGPEFRYPNDKVTLFAHGLVGGHHFEPIGAVLGGRRWGPGLMAGGGIDVNMFRNVDWRIGEFDWVYGHHRFNGTSTNNEGPEFRSGLVFKFGTVGPPPIPPSASCSLQPTEVFAGEPVKATATGSNFNPKRTVTYTWSGTGVKVNGTGDTVDIDTKDLQPGQYTVKSDLSDGKKGTAECTGSFTVKQPRPPVISCSADPTSVEAGQTSTISCQGSSPDNHPVTFHHSASAGNLTENGPNATLATTGAQPGPITVTSTVTDDRNLSANATTSVTVQAPPPPPPPPAEASKLSDINFKKNNARVDNAAKAALDDVALRMQREADSKLVIIGNTDPKEKGKNLSAQRAVNAKAYLVTEKGIDASRIEVRSGGTGGMTDSFYIVPAGAQPPSEGTAIDESKVKAKAAPAHHRRAKRAVAKKK